MEEKKNEQIGENISSGAEKVENVQMQNAFPTPQSVGKQKDKGSAKLKKEKEEKAAKKRVEKAKAKKQKKAKLSREERRKQAKIRLAELEKQAEKRAAERKANKEKRAAERKAKKEKRAAEREARIRDRAHAKANRRLKAQRAQEKKKAQRAQKMQRAKNKENRKNRENRENRGRHSYGGWLAACVSLGAITLALTTALTVGAIEMKKMGDGLMGNYKSTTYEIMGIMEHVGDDLDRMRVSNSPVQQERILTDLLVQSRLAVLDLEKMPIDGAMDSNLTAFINRVGATSEGLLTKLRLGGSLSEEDMQQIERLYQTTVSAKDKVAELSQELDDTMLNEFIKKGKGKIQEVLSGLEDLTLEENGRALEDKMKKMEGAGMERKALPEQKEGGKERNFDPAKAEEICKEYFKNMQIENFQCVGESVERGYTAFNLQGYDKEGTLLFAQIDANSGKLVRFNYYEPCENIRFDMQNSQTIAEEFLASLGYENMQAVRVRESETDADFTFVFKQGEVRVDPDEVKVKICRDRGVVTSFDASKYLKNHKQRELSAPKMDMQEAQSRLHKNLTVEKGELALVRAKGGERQAYEFVCAYGKERYFIYIDANTGNEIAILNAKNR